MNIKNIVGGVLIAAAPVIAGAQAFPNKAINLVVPFPPGGVTDPFARVVGPKVAESIGQQILIDNKPGAAGIIAAEFVKNANPDGYTLLMGHGGTHAVNSSLYSKLPYDPVKDFAPITTMIQTKHMLVVPAASPAKTASELVALAKTRKLSYASQSVGAGGHLLGEMLKMRAGVDMTHVPYKGSAPAVQDIVAGRVDLFFDALITSGPQVRGGKLRALAMASPRRAPQFPDVPTMAEAGFPGIELDFWFALYAPAATPTAVITRLNTEFVKAMKSPDVFKLFGDLGLDVITSTPAELAKLGIDDTARLGKMVRDAGAKAD
ncbi:MAG: Bug family tripartite tricarboxylate transporter substrate binding protein [Burkholderiales bacterium]